MKILVVVVNHGTTDQLSLMLKSLVGHHDDRSSLQVKVYDNESGDLAALDWCREYGVTIEQSGYGLSNPGRLNTHGEILAKIIQENPDHEAYLLADPDMCFVEKDTIHRMAAELLADSRAYCLQARPLDVDGNVKTEGAPEGARATFLSLSKIADGATWAQPSWTPPVEYTAAHVHGSRGPCQLILNLPEWRRAVELFGLSPAQTNAVEGARWWDTHGLVAAAMATHNRTAAFSSIGVLHIGGASVKPYRPGEYRAESLRRIADYTPAMQEAVEAVYPR